MFMRASDIMGEEGERPRGSAGASGGRPGTGGYSSGGTPGASPAGRHNYGFGGNRPVTSATAGGYGRHDDPPSGRPNTTGGALEGNLGLAGALPSTTDRRSMLQKQAELQRKRRAARRTGGFMATSRPTIDGPDAPRSPMSNPQRTRNVPQFSAPRYTPAATEPTVTRTAFGGGDSNGGSSGKSPDYDPPADSHKGPMSSPGSASGMSLAEVIRERERAKQRDTRSPQVNLAAMSDVEKQLMRKGIPASYDPGVSRTTMAESKSAAESLDFSDMRKFLTEPTPRSAGVVQCYIHRFKSGMNKLFPLYHVFMKDGDRFLLAAKKRSKQRTSNYLVSMDKDDLKRTGENFVGKLRSNFVGTEFTVYDDGAAPKDKGPSEKMRNELAVVTYASNVLGSKGPRKMKVVVPKVNPGTNERVEFKPMGKDGEMSVRLKANDLSQMVYMINKPPRWNEAVGAYVLNFNGRVTMASVKNFQLVDPEDQENVLLQFGRVGKDVFNMDYQWPLSPLQAFAICLSSFDYKIACE